MEPLNEQKLLDVLIHEHYITEADAKNAAAYAASGRGTAREYLLNNNIITPDLIGQAIAELYFMPYADLNSHPPQPEQVAVIPEETARRLRAVVFKQDPTTVTIATDAPRNELTSEPFITLFTGKKISLVYALTEDIDAAFVHYRKPLATRFSEILKTKKPIAPELLSLIMQDALSFHASDIHFETEKERIVVRFRVDGVLRTAGAVSRELYEMLLNRIKVLSHIRTDEHQAPQDGAIQWVSPTATVDMRVSVVPTVEGENTVIRILTSYVQSLALTSLGVSSRGQQLLAASVAKPFGMVLITGPTGSGKTTTLYALLKILNRPDVNIMTIEDPVEYRIQGINQIQVNPQTDLTFAKGLKSIIRQDPNIVLVGEIRDRETAEIAVNAALTGQLLLSTFHANDAATAIPRLVDMGIEPFLLASTLELVVAQRLVRKICESCRVSYSFSAEEISALPVTVRPYYDAVSTSLYKGKGCSACGGSGFRGRTSIFEMIEVGPDMEALILTRPSSQAIWEKARGAGAISLFEDGMEKVKNGVTTLTELVRVAMPGNVSKP